MLLCGYVDKLMDVETACKSAENDVSALSRRLAETDDDRRVTELSLRTSLDASHQTEYQLRDDRRRLERALDEAGTRLIESKLRTSDAEARVAALKSQLAEVRHVVVVVVVIK